MGLPFYVSIQNGEDQTFRRVDLKRARAKAQRSKPSASAFLDGSAIGSPIRGGVAAERSDTSVVASAVTSQFDSRDMVEVALFRRFRPGFESVYSWPNRKITPAEKYFRASSSYYLNLIDPRSTSNKHLRVYRK